MARERGVGAYTSADTRARLFLRAGLPESAGRCWALRDGLCRVPGAGMGEDELDGLPREGSFASVLAWVCSPSTSGCVV
jgi:hypothetical protein